MKDAASASSCSAHSHVSRRGFLAAASAAGVTIVKPELVRGSAANSQITLGLLGCGGRGKWIGKLFQKHGGYRFAAVADYFTDRAEAAGALFQVPVDKCFSTLSGYRRVLEAKPDAIVIETPPYFHPEQALAGVEAGCHVYCAKPVAVDAPGCATIADAGRKGTAARRCVLVDFQTRANEFYQEAVRRVHGGDIGPVVAVEAVYYCGATWQAKEASEGLSDPETRLRYWGVDKVLSGDVITEQNVHALDVAAWVMKAPPLRAYGLCGRGGRPPYGTCHDHFAVTYAYPNDVTVAFASKQCGTGYDDIGCRAFGPKGTLDTHYFGLVYIRGEKSYKGGKLGNLFTEGAVQNIASFHDDISKGNYANATVEPSVQSTLVTILGRTAAYKKAEVAWNDLLKQNERLEYSLAGLKS